MKDSVCILYVYYDTKTSKMTEYEHFYSIKKVNYVLATLKINQLSLTTVMVGL
jgi:hypothetical protein